MTQIAKLQRLQHPEMQERREISWACLCCHDSGVVVTHLVQKYLIEDYQWTDPPLICQKPGCRGDMDANSRPKMPTEGVDFRATPAICQQIHEAEWKASKEEAGKRPRIFNSSPEASSEGDFTRVGSVLRIDGGPKS